MSNKTFYLKPNVVIEPLIESWYAWSHLVSPATASMNITGRLLPIMESYIMDPEAHAEAVLNPKMRGGPFMDFKEGRIAEVMALQGKILEHRNDLVEFSNAIFELDELLLSDAKGSGLELLYEKVPTILKGYVELYYDRNNNPGFRFFEKLLYKSRYYNKSSQSIALWITNNDHRPFCLSTPRLKEQNVIQLPIAFDHIGIDSLAKMKRAPNSLEYIEDQLKISLDQKPLFETFFTDEPFPNYKKYSGNKVRMRYFGHACILLETREVSILIDPLISYYGYFTDLEHFSDYDLPDSIDYVLISHNHQDHILFETLLPLKHKIKNLIVPRTRSGELEDPNLKLMFDNIGFSNVTELGNMETLKFANAEVTSIPFTGEHCDLNIVGKSCYLVKIGIFSILFMADSRVVDANLYQNIFKEIGKVDVIFLGMECDGAPLSWLYGPLFTRPVTREQDRSRRLSGSDCARGMSLVDIFQPSEAYVYAMGQEPWVEFISSIKYSVDSNPIIQSDLFVKKCRDRGIISERLYGEKELFY